MVKTVIIINGSGGVGKDTLCSIADEYYSTTNVSSIDPIKRIAEQLGWDGEKDKKGRKLLSDIKAASIQYNDFPTNHVVEEFKEFESDEYTQLMFIHIREPEEIEKVKDKIEEISDIRVITLLVTRAAVQNNGDYGNKSDDSVAEYKYDYTYKNDKSLEEVKTDFPEFMRNTLGIKNED